MKTFQTATIISTLSPIATRMTGRERTAFVLSEYVFLLGFGDAA